MSEHRSRPRRVAFNSPVRISVSDEQEIYECHAQNLSSGGMFVHDDQPRPVGSIVGIEFCLPNGEVLCRVAGKVAHSRRPQARGDSTAGMGIEFIDYDDAAKAVLEKLAVSSPRIADEPASSPATRSHGEVLGAKSVEPNAGAVIGIDFGTTNTCAAIVEDGRARVLSVPRLVG